MCNEEGCDRDEHAKGLCQAHYRQALRRARGLKKPGPKPEPEKPGSRHNPMSSKRATAERPSDSKQESRRKFATDTHCANGHEFTEQNTYTYPPEHAQAGERVCKICRRNSQRKYKGLDPVPDEVPVGTWNKHKTECVNGHEFTPENTGTKSDGSRRCKRCQKAQRIEKTYGISLESFEQMLEDQEGCCFICRKPFEQESDAHLDHCHVSGSVRGLLCSNCNNGLGRFLDNPEFLRRAADYLESFGYEVIP